MVDKTTRSSEMRSKTARKTGWRRPSSLDAPPAPPGFKHRWIRMEVQGFDDRKNMIGRLREGFELVRADEYPDWELPTIDDGRYSGVIGVGGLALARIPEEIVAERSEYFREMTEGQQEAVDNDFFKEEHPSMPISKPDRQSRVTFGAKSKKS